MVKLVWIWTYNVLQNTFLQALTLRYSYPYKYSCSNTFSLKNYFFLQSIEQYTHTLISSSSVCLCDQRCIFREDLVEAIARHAVRELEALSDLVELRLRLPPEVLRPLFDEEL